MTKFADANKFVLRGRDLIVTYGETGLDGTPYLSYDKTGYLWLSKATKSESSKKQTQAR
jgi:hypothetical protein